MPICGGGDEGRGTGGEEGGEGESGRGERWTPNTEGGQEGTGLEGDTGMTVRSDGVRETPEEEARPEVTLTKGDPFLSLLPPPLGTGLLPYRTSTLMPLPSDPSVFDILNLFRRQWFLSRDWLVSNVTSAQRTDDSSIDWVKFPPVAHTHLVRCAIKLAPSIPTAKVKWVMFVFLLEVLNGDGPVSSFFAPRRVRAPCKRRTRKPREGGAQPVGAMAVDSPPPVAPSEPDPPGPLSPGLVPGNGDPSSEEPAGDGFNPISGQASSSPGVSPTPSDRTVLAVSPSQPGPSRPPSVLGVKRSPLPASPSPPPSIPPGLPSSPPPPPGSLSAQLPQDWQDWIVERHRLAGHPRLGRRTGAKDVEGLLLAQVEAAGPPLPLTLAPAPAPRVVVPPGPPPSSIPSYPGHEVSPLLNAAGIVVGWRLVNLVAPSEWAEFDLAGCVHAMFDFDPPHHRPYPGWAPRRPDLG